MKYLLFLSILALSGCVSSKPVPVPPVDVPELEIIEPSLPTPVTLEAPTFYVLTEKNFQSFFNNTGEGSAFSVSAQGYEILSRNVQEMRRYILELQKTIEAYKKLLKPEQPGADSPE